MSTMVAALTALLVPAADRLRCSRSWTSLTICSRSRIRMRRRLRISVLADSRSAGRGACISALNIMMSESWVRAWLEEFADIPAVQAIRLVCLVCIVKATSIRVRVRVAAIGVPTYMPVLLYHLDWSSQNATNTGKLLDIPVGVEGLVEHGQAV